MKELQIFNSPQFGQIRVVGTPNEPLFRAYDICTALGYSNPRKAIADHVDEGDVTKRDTPTFNQYGTEVIQQAIFINESGLYALIFGSKLESAKAFKKWVTSEVLPSIRKTGMYVAGAVLDEDTEQQIRSALTYAQETMARQSEEIRLLRELADERKRTLDLQQLIIEERKSATPAIAQSQPTQRQSGRDRAKNAPKTYTTTQIAQEVGMSAFRLNRILYGAGVVNKGKYWPIAKKYADKGLKADSLYTYYYQKNPRIHATSEWTEKGREFIINLINNQK